MAFRMQASVPDLVDTSKRAGARAMRCMARTRASRAPLPPTVCWPAGWPSATCGSFSSIIAAGITMAGSRRNCRRWRATPTRRRRRLILDLKQRGMLDDTLVIWGGEFGRTPYAQGAPKPDSYGRDHHGRVFSLWMAGGGVKRGLRPRQLRRLRLQRRRGRCAHPRSAGDDPAPAGDRSREADLPFQGRQFRLTDVGGQVVKEIIA